MEFVEFFLGESNFCSSTLYKINELEKHNKKLKYYLDTDNTDYLKDKFCLERESYIAHFQGRIFDSLKDNEKIQNQINEIREMEFPEEYQNFKETAVKMLEESISNIEYLKERLEETKTKTFEHWLKSKIDSQYHAIEEINKSIQERIEKEQLRDNLKKFLNDQDIQENSV